MLASWLLTFFRWILLLLALAGVVVTSIPAISGDTWWVRYLDFPRIEFLIAMLIVALLLALVPRTRLTIMALAALAAACAYDAFVLFPYTSIPKPQQLAVSSCPQGSRLRLLEVNVQMTNRHDHKLRDMVRQADPDIAWFQETNEWWHRELSSLKDRMPYGVSKVQPNYFGVELFSRLPLIDPRVMSLTGSYNPSIFTGVKLPSGQAIRLYAIHPRPPQAGQSTAERDAQILATALAAHADSEPHVTAGDMNSVPWEDVIHQMERVGRFLDPRIGRGFYITWNAKSPIMKWPLDQILPGPDFTLLSLKVLPAFGSDHRPYLADLCVEPGAARYQSPPAAQPGDIASAKAAVSKGQGKAEKEGYKGHYGPEGTQSK